MAKLLLLTKKVKALQTKGAKQYLNLAVNLLMLNESRVYETTSSLFPGWQVIIAVLILKVNI